MDEITNEEFMENEFLHEVEGLADIIAEYEDEGYFENDICVLLVENGCFNFREVRTGKIFKVEYGEISRYDSEDYSDEQLSDMSRAIGIAKEYGFEV